MRTLTSALLSGAILLTFLIPSASQAAITTPLSYGSQGAQVTELQTYLHKAGYLAVNPTGFFGPLTRAAVQAFQTANNLEPVGHTGPLTRALLAKLTSDSGTIDTSPVETPSTPTKPVSDKTRPSLTFKSSVYSITSGSAARLTWSGKNITSCKAEGAWSENRDISGVETLHPKATGTYILVCEGANGSVTKSVTVTVTNETQTTTTPDPTLVLTADATRVPSGGAVTLTWASTNATSCVASGAWSGTKATAGTQKIANITANSSFKLVCSGAGGSRAKEVNVSIADTVPPPAPAPTLSLSADVSSVTSGGAATLTWSSTNATVCTASGAWTGTKATSGTLTVSNLTTNSTYTLVCTGAGGSVSKQVSITVTAPTPTPTPAPTVSLSSSASSVASGSAITLTWSSTNASACTASGAWSGTQPTSGSVTISNVTTTSTYTLICTGTGGSASKQVTVTVTSSTPPPTTGIIPASDSAALNKAIAGAKDGSTITLAGGTYVVNKIQGGTFTNGITITSADPANPATLGSVSMQNESGVTLRNLKLTGTLILNSVSNVTVDKVEFAGNGTTPGVSAQYAKNLTISNSKFHDLSSGVVATRSSNNAKILNNTFYNIRVDGIQFSLTSFVTITGNHFTNYKSQPGDHSDNIQFFTLGATVPATDIVITDNEYIRGNGTLTQGIFMGNESNITYKNVTIRHNAFVGSMYQGIALFKGDNVVIDNNFVQGYTDMNSWINLQYAVNSSVTNNKATSFINLSTNTNLVNTGNTTIAATPVGDLSAYLGWGKIASAAPSTSSTVPTLSQTLAVGTTGEQVRTLQQLLANLGHYHADITGYFGAVTKAAVNAYQAENGLAAVGIVGPQTRTLLNSLLK